MARKAGFKSLSPRTVPEKTQIRLPKDLMEWLREKAKEQGKSLSLILTEMLEEVRRRGGKG